LTIEKKRQHLSSCRAFHDMSGLGENLFRCLLFFSNALLTSHVRFWDNFCLCMLTRNKELVIIPAYSSVLTNIVSFSELVHYSIKLYFFQAKIYNYVHVLIILGPVILGSIEVKEKTMSYRLNNAKNIKPFTRFLLWTAYIKLYNYGMPILATIASILFFYF
jgi:hypothetical protein